MKPPAQPHPPPAGGWHWRILAAAALVAAAPFAQAQPSAGNFSFGQLDWYDEEGALVLGNSRWGVVAADLTPDATQFAYVNIVASTGTSSNAWIVRNWPIFPATIGNGALRQQVDFDTAQLGLVEGDPLLSVFVNIDVGLNVLDSPPPGTMAPVTVQTVNQLTFGSRLESRPLAPGDVGAPAGIAVTNAPTDVIQHHGTPAVQEERIQCLPGSMARSIGWLNTAYGLGSTNTAQQIYTNLVGFDNPVRLSYEQFVAQKQSYLSNFARPKRAVTKILDLGNAIGPVNGVPESAGTNLVDWLAQELPTEDVELHYGQHIITLTGSYRAGGRRYVKYRDDETQGNNATGDTAEKTAEISFDGTNWTFRGITSTNEVGRVRAMVSESIIETYALDDSGNIRWTSGVATNSTAIADGVPPNGGWLVFNWTSGQVTPGQPPRPHPRYQPYAETNSTGARLPRRFLPPNDPTVTDWYQEVGGPGGRSGVWAGNIRSNSPWAFHALTELPVQTWRIPDLAPQAATPDVAVYTAVNLEQYLAANPNGFLNGAWSRGQTLGQLGLQIVNGQMPGLEGIYWATTPFTFDPDSATGWVPAGGNGAWLDSDTFETAQGPIEVLAEHDGQPSLGAGPGLSIESDGLTVLISFATEPGRSYELQRATTLSPPDWSFFQQVPGDGNPAYFEDLVVPFGRLYRVEVFDQP